ncbi:MAG: branched-chain amino acid ABC transporter substrate-binding protein [Hydrogenophaga sp.]|nr:branched-chain amino acid ABC transporter substrate-binding protein [Hydrogenophaga sp.]
MRSPQVVLRRPIGRSVRLFHIALLNGVLGASAAAAAAESVAGPLAGQTVRMAFIDPLSGPAADIGRNSLRSWQFMAERRSGAGNPAGLRFIVAGFDNKGSPQESLNALKVAIDQGFRYIVQGNGSGVAAAISDAVARHNQRHPEQTVLHINYAATDPALTNEKCSFWHFRIDADTAMKMRALTAFMAEQPGLDSVYLLNQNYAHGQQFSRYFRDAMAQQRPDVQIVGDELHPPFQGVDFTRYARRVKASGAHALATGNWGSDLRDLVRALQKEGVTIPLYAYYPGLKGVPEVLAQTGERMPVYQVAYHHSNQEGPIGELAAAFRQRYGEDMAVYASYDGIEMLAQAMADVGSTDPARVAPRLSGMIFKGFNGPVHLRADDHQLQKGQYISRWQKVDAQHPRSAGGTGYTFAPVKFLHGAELSSPVRCQMARP